MDNYTACCIKSFKHNGQLHRMWLENWMIGDHLLDPAHTDMHVLINDQTRIVESDGKQWTSKIPGVSFFIPGAWYNIVALLEPAGTRYYCNVASPPYLSGNVLTYIDYDLDAVVMPDGSVQVLDEEEYELHRRIYHYSSVVDDKVREGLEALLDRIGRRLPPFRDETVRTYYEDWRRSKPE